eukprot:4860456-Pyramimonas_sp.AAC.1
MEITRFPLCVYWDWMHNYVSSGGLAQYQLNYFAMELNKYGISLEDLDNFTNALTFPNCAPSWKRTFWQDRVVRPCKKNEQPHIKAFAAEVIRATDSLDCFSDQFLRGHVGLKKHVDCLHLLSKILGLLRAGDAAVQRHAELERWVIQHQTLYRDLYVGKPKFHYAGHVPDCIQRHG